MNSRAAVQPASPRTTFVVLAVMVTSVVTLQRIAIPFGEEQVSLSLPVVVLGMGYLLLAGQLVEDRLRTGLYLLAVSLCLTAALVSFVLNTVEASFGSALLLVVLYAPFAYVLRPDLHALYGRLLDFFCRLMVVGAIVSLGQWLAQMLGWRYTDLLADVVPSALLLENYATAYPVRYGSEIYKSNGVFFLEPSFCSQFLALAVIIQLVRGGKRWRLPVYAAGIIPTVAGTGLLLLAFGLMLVSLRRRPIWSFAVLVVTVLTAALVAITPAGDPFVQRTTETTTRGSSFSLRFVEPYEHAYEDLGADERTPFTGRGPGYTQRRAEADVERTDLMVLFPVLPKLVAEYGLIAAVAFTVFTIYAFCARVPASAIALSILFMHLTLSGSLLQPTTVYLSLVLTSLFATVVPLSRAAAAPADGPARGPVLARGALRPWP
jgi:hypothetical protein